MTRYIAIPKERPEAPVFTESMGGFAPATRAGRIEALRNLGLEEGRRRMSESLGAKIESGLAPGYRVVATPDRQMPLTGVTIVEGDAAAVEDLQNDLPDYEIIEDFAFNLIEPTISDGPMPETAHVDTWHLDAVRLSAARQQGFTGSGEGIGIAVLDTGVNEVDELDGRIAAALELDSDLNLVEIATTDTHGHGTGVAALIAGSTVGIAPGVDITNVITIPNRQGTFSNFLAACEFVAGRADISVANISAGVPDWDARIRPGIQALLASHVCPIVAVGNDGADTSRSPGNYAEVVSVGACRQDGTVWSGSGSEALDIDGENYAVPNLVAPGHRVMTCDGDGIFKRFNGSSLAAPIVSGLTALIIERFPTITIPELRDAIFEACETLEDVEALRQGRGIAQVPPGFYHLGS